MRKDDNPSPLMGEGGPRSGSDGGGASQEGEATPPRLVQGRTDKPTHVPGAIKRARRLRQDMPWAQEKLWQALRRLRLNIRREAPLGRFTVDFAQHAAKLVIEVDGYWHAQGDRPERDAERDSWMRSQGYEIVRISEAEVAANIEGAALRIGALISSRLPAAPPPSDPAPRGHLPSSRGKDL